MLPLPLQVACGVPDTAQHPSGSKSHMEVGFAKVNLSLFLVLQGWERWMERVEGG